MSELEAERWPPDFPSTLSFRLPTSCSYLIFIHETVKLFKIMLSFMDNSQYK
jgi:hypothetical protein